LEDCAQRTEVEKKRKSNHLAKLFIWCLSKAVIAVKAMQRWTTQRAGREMGNEEGTLKPVAGIPHNPKKCPTLMITFPVQTGPGGGCRVPHVRNSVRGMKKLGDPDFLYAAPPMFACAAFCKESRMKFVDLTKPHRKPGGSPTIAFHAERVAGKRS
jgi:hypothetical protein